MFPSLDYDSQTSVVSSFGGTSKLLRLPFPLTSSNRDFHSLSSVFASEALPGTCRCSAFRFRKGDLEGGYPTSNRSGRYLPRGLDLTASLAWRGDSVTGVTLNYHFESGLST